MTENTLVLQLLHSRGVFLSGRGNHGQKTFKDCSKTVHKSGRFVRYTKHVDEGSRNPESADSQPIFYFSFPPLFSIL